METTQAKLDLFEKYSYSSFPKEKYGGFIARYVSPYLKSSTSCLDLGCGTGGLISELQSKRLTEKIVGIDISTDALNHLKTKPTLDHSQIELLHQNAIPYLEDPSNRGRFDLIVSYSVLQYLPGSTETKFNLLASVCKPGAIIAIDWMARMPWNVFIYGVVKILIRLNLFAPILMALRKFIAPSFPKEFVKELGQMNYLTELKYENYVDVNYFESAVFKRKFEVLKLEVVPQDSFFTGRKARFTLRVRS